MYTHITIVYRHKHHITQYNTIRYVYKYARYVSYNTVYKYTR